jgi:hypothetical protein
MSDLREGTRGEIQSPAFLLGSWQKKKNCADRIPPRETSWNFLGWFNDFEGAQGEWRL